MKKLGGYFLTFVITFLLSFLLLVLIALISKEVVKEHVNESAEYLYHTGVYAFFNDYHDMSYFINRYQEPITLNLAYSLDQKHPIDSSILTKYYDVERYGKALSFREKAIHDYESNQEYYRYWHGNMALVKILLIFFNYHDMLIFLSVVLVLLGLGIIYNLWKKDKKLAIFFFIANIVVNVVVVFYCLEYIYMFLLSYILTLISFKLINSKEETLIKFFIVGGVLSNFFDFLTTETMVFTLPFLVIFYFRYKEKRVDKKAVYLFIKCLLAFLISYSMMWAMKWLILMIFYHLSPSEFLTDHIIERGINDRVFRLGLSESIYENILRLFPLSIINNEILIWGLIIGYIIFLVINFIIRRFRLKEWILVLISLVPILRYLVMNMHSYDHSFFTYRALLPSIMICLLLIFRGKKKINNRIKIVSRKKIKIKNNNIGFICDRLEEVYKM